MKQRTKENLGNIFGSLVSNQRAINGAKHNPWWVAIIMFILAVLLPVVPITVSTANSTGDSFLAERRYSWDTQIVASSLALKDAGIDFVVGENDTINMTKDGVDYTSDKPDTDPIYNYINTAGTNQIDFQVYYSERPVKGATKNTPTIQDLIDELVAKRWESGTANEQEDAGTNPGTSESEETKTYYRPNFVLLYKEGFYNYLAVPNSVDKKSQGAGDWKNTLEGTKLIETVLTVEGETNQSVLNSKYVEGVYNNWIKVYNDGYKFTRTQATWSSSLVFLGVYSALSFFMGLMIFLLTRGKNNPFRYLTFWACFKINAWASVAPGILSLILGFIIPSYSMMFFIILHGMRIMWMTTKQLRPQY